MNTADLEQIADRLIAQRSRRRGPKPTGRRKASVRINGTTVYKLTEAECWEFRKHVQLCINALSRAQTGVPPLRTALQAGLSAGLLFSSEGAHQTGLRFGNQQRVDPAAPALEGQAAASALGVE